MADRLKVRPPSARKWTGPEVEAIQEKLAEVVARLQVEAVEARRVTVVVHPPAGHRPGHRPRRRHPWRFRQQWCPRRPPRPTEKHGERCGSERHDAELLGKHTQSHADDEPGGDPPENGRPPAASPPHSNDRQTDPGDEHNGRTSTDRRGQR